MFAIEELLITVWLSELSESRLTSIVQDVSVEVSAFEEGTEITLISPYIALWTEH